MEQVQTKRLVKDSIIRIDDNSVTRIQSDDVLYCFICQNIFEIRIHKCLIIR